MSLMDAAWIEAATAWLSGAVAALPAGTRLSVSERVTDGPVEGWWFAIDAPHVVTGAGTMRAADLRVTATYEQAVAAARTVYDPSVADTLTSVPEPLRRVLVDLHNHMATSAVKV